MADHRAIEFDLQNVEIDDRRSKDENIDGFILKENSYDNSAFTSDQTLVSRGSSGIIVTTNLQENENKDDDPADLEKNNAGFEKLPDEGNRVGLLVLKIRDFLFSFIEKQKIIAGYVIKALFLIGFIIYFGFAMSVQYGTPAFPIKGNVFYGNPGRIIIKSRLMFLKFISSRFCVILVGRYCYLYLRMGKISWTCFRTFN